MLNSGDGDGSYLPVPTLEGRTKACPRQTKAQAPGEGKGGSEVAPYPGHHGQPPRELTFTCFYSSFGCIYSVFVFFRVRTSSLGGLRHNPSI